MIEKEFRALLPLWAGAGLALFAAPYAPRGFEWIGPLAYLLGLAGVGGWSVGHDFSLRTMDTLLMLPVSRSRIWWTKMGVAAVMLATFTLLARWTLERAPGTAVPLSVYYLAGAVALFVAPWLTVVSRTPLAGMVFPLGIAGTLSLIGARIGFWLYRSGPGASAAFNAFFSRFMIASMVLLCAMGAALGWRAFMALESLGAPRIGVPLPARRSDAARAARPGHPIWMLVKKELRLQQLALTIVPVYGVAFVLLKMTQAGPARFADQFEVVTLLYAAILATLFGALASADERQLGTHDAQLLLPVAAARQWMVKAGCVLILTAIFGVALPVALVGMQEPPAKTVALIAGFSCVALYVSTLSTSGVRALLWTVPVLATILAFTLRFAFVVSYWTFDLLYVRKGHPTPYPRVSVPLLLAGGIAVLGVVAVIRAFHHYRYADRRPLRVLADAALVAVSLVLFWAIQGALA